MSIKPSELVYLGNNRCKIGESPFRYQDPLFHFFITALYYSFGTLGIPGKHA